MAEREEIHNIYIKNEPGRAGKTLDCIMPLLAYIAINLILSVILGIAMAVMVVVLPGEMNAFDLLKQGNTSLAVTAIMDTILIVVAYFMYRHDRMVMGKAYGLRNEPRERALTAALAILMGIGASIFINMGASLLQLNEFIEKYAPQRLDFFGNNPFLEFLSICVLAPIAEELVFRAGVFGRMRKYTRFWPAALVSAALFGVVHLELVTAVSAFLIGLVMAWLFEKTESVYTSILFHFGFNFFPTLADIYNTAVNEGGAEALQVPDTAASYSNVMTAVMAVYLAISVLMFIIPFIVIKRKKKEELVRINVHI